jgi:hypothetical protein
MAYTRSLNAPTQFGDPLVVSVVGTCSTAATDLPVKVPWNNVDLVYAYTVLTTIIDTGDCAFKIEDGTGGTTVATATITQSGCAVGDIDELTNLQNTDVMNVEIDGASGNGQFTLWMYFEPSQYA